VAKPKPKHPAPVAATESDTNSGLTRIIELSAKWQEPSRWTQVLKAAKEFRKYRGEAVLFSGMIRIHGKRERELRSLVLDGIPSEDEHSLAVNELAIIQEWNEERYEQLQADVQRYNSLSEDRYQQVIDAQQELIELKNLVRQHTPQLLECTPDVDFGVSSEEELEFFLDAPEVDHSPLCRDLRKLEGRVRVLPPAKPLGSDDPKENRKESRYLFGMKIDAQSKMVSRYNTGISQESVCRIENDDQWELFMLVVNNGGTVAADVLRAKLLIKSERDRTVSRLRTKLQGIQLTFSHGPGQCYALKEFPG